MTEPIIIDGVDVAGCRYLFDDTAYKHSKTQCSITLKDCKYLGNNCYYKQLKRLEQENEKLKKEVKQIGSSFIKKGDYARALEQENAELKRDIETRTMCVTCKRELQNCNLKTENAKLKELEKDLDNLQTEYLLDDRDEDEVTIPLITQIKERLDLLDEIEQENENYKSALEEIKKKCNWIKDCSVTNDNMWEYDEILEIINEVLQ